MDLTSIKAKIAAGVLPSANGVGAHAIRYVAGVCVGCDMTIRWSDLCIQFGVGSRESLLHADCYVLWTEACSTQ